VGRPAPLNRRLRAAALRLGAGSDGAAESVARAAAVAAPESEPLADGASLVVFEPVAAALPDDVGEAGADAL
jgi:hypothetical protein